MKVLQQIETRKSHEHVNRTDHRTSTDPRQ
jgi:hypothetical protein